MNTNHQTTIPVSAAKADAVHTVTQAIRRLATIWGHSDLGLVLCNAFFTGDHLTSEQLAEECHVSNETIRRWIKPLITIDRVRVIKVGRNVRYTAREEWANRTAEMLMQLHDEIEERRGKVSDLSVVPLKFEGVLKRH